MCTSCCADIGWRASDRLPIVPGHRVVLKTTRRLGGGGMADVYLGSLQSEDGRTIQVAVKRIRTSLNAEMALLIERESAILRLLDHPNIVRLRASGEDAEGPFLAVDY